MFKSLSIENVDGIILYWLLKTREQYYETFPKEYNLILFLKLNLGF